MSKRPLRSVASAPLEDDIHDALAQFLTVAIAPPGEANGHGVMWWTVEHRNARNAVEGAKRKKRGVVAGLPDVYVLFGGRLLAIELKRPGYAPSTVSAAQRKFHAAMKACGATVTIKTSTESVAAFLTACRVPLRASLS